LKKLLLISILILSFTGGAYALDEDGEYSAVTPEELQGTNFFKSPMNAMLNDLRDEPIYRSFDEFSYGSSGSSGVSDKEINESNMPLFKQMRLNLNNKWNNLTSEKTEEEIAQKKEARKNRLEKFFKKKSAEQNVNSTDLTVENGALSSAIQDEINKQPDEDTLSLESGISEQITEKQLQLDCESVNFDDETGEMIATGRPQLYIPPQKTRVIADKMTYSEDGNILKASGNVIVIRDGVPTLSDYFEVDMNEETMLMNNLQTKSETMLMSAERGIQQDSKLILEDGTFYSEESEVHRLSSKMIGPRFANMTLDDDDRSFFLSDPRGSKVHLNAERIYVEGRKNHDVFTVKNLEVRRKGKYWFTWPSLTAYTNKDRDYFEGNYPEFGTRRKVGMFVGPGFVFGGPNGSIVKVIPFLNYQHSKFGIGGALKYRNTYNMTELGYGSSADIFFLRGRQRLDDHLYLQYSANSFMDEWFLGSRMPKYMAEVFYDRGYKNKDFLAPGRTLTFRHRAGFGLMQDNDTNYYGEKLSGNNTTTTRLRYMAEIRQALYSYSNPEHKFFFDVAFAMQGSAAVYGTGDTQFIGRIGPSTHIQYKNWMQDLAYYQSGYDDKTPVPRYDAYRYGHSSLYISEIIRLNKYLSAGWSGTVNLSDDSPNGKLFQENRFVVALGPDDLKIHLGYDFVRQTTYFGFNVAFDTKGTTIDFGRMEIKNPERLGKRQDREEHQVAFAPSQNSSETKNTEKKTKTSTNNAVLKHAQVIEIEDPNMEKVQ
jgi:hypothetical protein